MAEKKKAVKNKSTPKKKPEEKKKKRVKGTATLGLINGMEKPKHIKRRRAT